MRNENLKKIAKEISMEKVISKFAEINDFEKVGDYLKCTCPFHNDNDPSFYINITNNRGKCYVCGGDKGMDNIEYIMKVKGIGFNSAIELITGESIIDVNSDEYKIRKYLEEQKKYSYKYKNMDCFKIFNDVYFYYDKDGKLESVKIKYLIEDTDGNKIKKIFSQHLIKDGKVEFKSTLGGLKNNLYNLPYVLQGVIDDKIICIVEGEKDANTLSKIGFIATTPRENKIWNDEMIQVFKGAKVAIFSDNDKAGRDRANGVIEVLKPVVESLRVVILPNIDELGEKADISDWIEFGHTKSELLQHISYHSLDIKNTFELQQDFAGIYKNISKGQNEDGTPCYQKINLSNFRVLSANLLENIDGEPPSYKVTLQNVFNKIIERELPHECFLEASKFNKALNDMTFVFNGDVRDLRRLMVWLRYFNTMTVKTCSIGGTRYINDKLLFVTKDGAMDSTGLTTESIRTKEQSFNSNLVKCDEITNDELRELRKHAFSWNKIDSVQVLMGAIFNYTLAHYYDKNYISMPQTAILGESGSGKSTVARNIVCPFNGYESDIKRSLGNITKFTMSSTLRESNQIKIFDEYKPSMWPQAHINMISEFIRNTYDRNVAERGTKDQRTITYKPISPMFLMGEEIFYGGEKAAFERFVMVYLTEEGRKTKEAEESMAWLENNKNIINKLGKTMFLNSMSKSDKEIKELIENTKIEISEYKSTLSPRVLHSLVSVVVGLKLFNEVVLLRDIELVNIDINSLVQYFKEHLLGGNSAIVSEVDKFFIAVDEMIGDNPMLEHFLVYKTDNGGLYHMNVTRIIKYLKDERYEEINGCKISNKTDLIKQLKAKEYLVDDRSSKVRTSLGTLNGYKIKVEKLKHLNLELFNNLILRSN